MTASKNYWRPPFPCRTHLPRFGFGKTPQGAGLFEAWQAYRGHEPIGPKRMFQWEAIDDLPLEAGVTLSKIEGRYSVLEPYRVGFCPSIPAKFRTKDTTHD